MVKQNATPDSSFWIHVVACGLVESLLRDFDVCVTAAVLGEMRESYPAGAELHRLVRSENIRIENPKTEALGLFGPGEKAAISLALERPEWTLLIDDVRPFRAAVQLGLEPVSSPAYIASLHQRGLVTTAEALAKLAALAVRATVSPMLIDLALEQVERAERKDGSEIWARN